MANFSLTWNVAAGTYQQELYLKNKYSGSWNLITTLNGTTNTYNLTGIPDNKIQQFKIKGFCTDGIPKESTVSEFANLTCPSLVTVTPACDGVVTYSFSQVGGDVNNYDVQLLSNTDVVITTQTKAAAATVTGSFTGLTASTPYKIKVTSKADTITKACTSVSFTSKPNSPVVTTQPINQAACDDQTVTLTAAYTCVGCSYQWYKGTVALSNTGDFSGVTTQTLTIANAGLNVGTYKLKGTNECATVETNAITVSLLPDTSVTVEPANNNVCVGATANFGVTAGGSNVTYQWQVSTDGGTTYANISGATSATYSFTVASGDNNKKYRTKVNSTCGPEITSLPGTLTTKTNVSISAQPVTVSVCPDANVTFNVTSSGTGLTYQWQKKVNTTWTNVSGATSASLTITNAVAKEDGAGTLYRVVCTGDCNSVISNEVTYNFYTLAEISTQPTNQTGCIGGNVTFSVSATGSNLTYQWQENISSTWTDITGATTNTWVQTGLTSGDNGKQFRVKVINSCNTVTSNTVTINIAAAVAISQQPNDQTVCDGANATFTVVASGAGLTYQWQRNSTGSWANITNATSASYVVVANATSITYTYRVIVTGTCGSETSTASSLSLASDAANWVQRDITQYYNCVGVNKHYQEIDTNPCSATYNTTRAGNLYESNSSDCGYVPCLPVTALSASFDSNNNL